MPRPLAITLSVLAAILLACFVRYAPPRPRGQDAPPTEASAERAREVQAAISREKRPVASDAIEQAREVLRASLEASGFEVTIQRGPACSHHGTCGIVSNVVGVRRGTDASAKSVVLMAHHDSVPCSRGASDDGVGTAAVIEAARAIGAGPPTRRTVVVVLTDAEESGLLGARAFHDQHPLAKSVAGVVNVDSRGGGGPSAMFETSAGNGWLVGELARTVARPVTSSLFYEIYRRMPNDTDFTALKSDARGLNFANIARIEAYHTPLDDLAHADLGTLQHHTDHALGMARALANAGPELEAPLDASADAVWFDVLAAFVVRWPAGLTLPLALAALVLVAAQTMRLRAFGALGRGQLAALGVLTSALGASLLMGAALSGIGAIPVPWVAHQGLALFAVHGATFATGLAVAMVFARQHASAPAALWSGTWLLFATIGLATAFVAPGGAFLFVVPSLVAGLAAFAPDRRLVVASFAPVVVAGVLLLPITILSNDALGLAIPALAAAPTTLLVAMLGPLAILPERPRRPLALRAMAWALAASLVALLAAAAAPKFSERVPQRVNVVVRADHEESWSEPTSTRVFVEASWGGFPWGPPPPSMLAALGDAPSTTVASTPWSTPAPHASLPPLDARPPMAVLLESSSANGRRQVHARVGSARGARSVIVSLRVGRRVAVSLAGVQATPRNGAVLLRAVPPEGLDLYLDAEGTEPIDGEILDVTNDLPPSAAHVVDARPKTAVETQEGDMTVISRRIRL